MKVEDNQCQCHVCLQQQGKTITTSLPPHIPPIVPRPWKLHLYPHIHGSSGLHSLNRGHVRPILQPSLYDLHSTQQRKSIVQRKSPIKLDFDSPEGIHNHINYAYGDWDNSYDARMYMHLSTTFDSKLLPPPPLSSPYTSTFLTEPFSVAGSFAAAIPASSVSSPSAFSSAVNNLVMTTATPATTKPLDGTSVVKETAVETVGKAGKCSNELGSPVKSRTSSCTRPVTLGGNNVPKVSEKLHSQHCKKHNPQGLAKPGNLI